MFNNILFCRIGCQNLSHLLGIEQVSKLWFSLMSSCSLHDGTEGQCDGSNLVLFLYTMTKSVEYRFVFFRAIQSDKE